MVANWNRRRWCGKDGGYEQDMLRIYMVLKLYKIYQSEGWIYLVTNSEISCGVK